MNDKKVKIVHKSGESLQIWHYNTLMYNLHSSGYQYFYSASHKRPVFNIIEEDYQLKLDLIQQLEDEGYFK